MVKVRSKTRQQKPRKKRYASLIKNLKEKPWETGPRIVLFGKEFIQSFKPIQVKTRKPMHFFLVHLDKGKHESPLSLALSFQSKKIGEIKLSFGIDSQNRKIVIVNGIQGSKGSVLAHNAFHKKTGMPWANYLIMELEKHAKKNGYFEVRILRPEKLKWYKDPVLSENLLLKKMCKRLGLPESLPFEMLADKLLRMKRMESAKLWRAVEKEAQEEIREKMRKLYYGIGRARGYKKHRDYLVKQI